MSLTLSVENNKRAVPASSALPASSILVSSIPGDETILFYNDEYREGDTLVLSTSISGMYIILQLDDALPSALVYLSGTEFRFQVPFADFRSLYGPHAFTGDQHLLSARFATDDEIRLRRNLAFNPYDTRSNGVLFPHASANVETRGESAFAARNTIDGLKFSTGHGEWPFTSWGINRDPDALLKIDFGRLVRVSSAVLYLRTDFPHDAWWESAVLCFSDGTSVSVPLLKIAGAQTIAFSERTVQWVAVGELVKAESPSPFPALTQFEMYGIETISRQPHTNKICPLEGL